MKRNIAWILKSIVKYSIISSLNSILSTVAKWKWNCSVVADSLRPHGLHSPWNSLGQNTGVDSFPFSRGSSQPRDRTQVSLNAGGFFTRWATKEVQEYWSGWQNIVPETMSFYTTIFTKVYFFSPQKIWGRVKFLLVPYCYACGYQFLLVDLFPSLSESPRFMLMPLSHPALWSSSCHLIQWSLSLVHLPTGKTPFHNWIIKNNLLANFLPWKPFSVDFYSLAICLWTFVLEGL